MISLLGTLVLSRDFFIQNLLYCLYMILLVDTSHPETIELSLLKNKKERGESIKVPAAHRQAELLLSTLEKLLKKTKAFLSAITEIQVYTTGKGFTSLRIGVVTANALAYALGIPVTPTKGKSLRLGNLSIATPHYDKPPTITRKKK